MLSNGVFIIHLKATEQTSKYLKKMFCFFFFKGKYVSINH